MSSTLILILPMEIRHGEASGFVLRRLCGLPAIRIVCRAARRASPAAVLVAVGPDPEALQDSLRDEPVQFVGADGARAAAGRAASADDVVALAADAPRIDEECIKAVLAHHRRTKARLTIAGRPVEGVPPSLCCFAGSRFLEVLEDNRLRDQATPLTLTGLFAGGWPPAGEFEIFLPEDAEVLRPLASEEDVADACRLLRLRKCRELMAAGVQIAEPGLAFIDLDARVEAGAVILPLVALEGPTQVQAGSVIYSGSRLSCSTIGRGARILDSCLITDSSVGDNSVVGPFAHLRDGARVGASCRVGNFVELKRTALGDGTKAAHLAYLGDAVIGKNVNIGAGTITCNYDGARKHVTIIEDGAFIGTDSQLVAPVRIGREAYVAAGSCITKDVPEGALAVARSRQTIKEGWARRLRRKN